MAYLTCKRFDPPQALPGDFFDELSPLASWVKRKIYDAYRAGYIAGRSDGVEMRGQLDGITANTFFATKPLPSAAFGPLVRGC